MGTEIKKGFERRTANTNENLAQNPNVKNMFQVVIFWVLTPWSESSSP
jgi:hypothetical protein